MKRYKRTAKKTSKFRSAFEALFAANLTKHKIDFGYEVDTLVYVKEHKYKVDFSLECDILVETKGYFTAADREKMLGVRKANPTLDIRLVFMKDQKIHKLSKTKYSDWCEKHGFKYIISPKGEIPDEWIREIKDVIRQNKQNKTKS